MPSRIRINVKPEVTRTVKVFRGTQGNSIVSAAVNGDGNLILTLSDLSTISAGSVVTYPEKFVLTNSATVGTTIFTSPSLSSNTYFIEVDGHALIPDPAEDDGYDWSVDGQVTLTTPLLGGEQVVATKYYTLSNVSHDYEFTYSYAGFLEVYTGTLKKVIASNADLNLMYVALSEAATGSDIIIDVLKNGVDSLLGGPFTISAGVTSLSQALTSTIAAGDYITTNIIQVGSVDSGKDLSLTFKGVKS